MNIEVKDLKEVLESCLPALGYIHNYSYDPVVSKYSVIYKFNEIKINYLLDNNSFKYRGYFLWNENNQEFLIKNEHLDKFERGIFKIDDMFYKVETDLWDNNYFYLILNLL